MAERAEPEAGSPSPTPGGRRSPACRLTGAISTVKCDSSRATTSSRVPCSARRSIRAATERARRLRFRSARVRRLRRVGGDGRTLPRAVRRRRAARARSRSCGSSATRVSSRRRVRPGCSRARTSDGPDPVSWLLIEPGWRVESADGVELGRVEEVAGDEGADIFDGLAVATEIVRRPRYVPAEQVGDDRRGNRLADDRRGQLRRACPNTPSRQPPSGSSPRRRRCSGA